MRRTAILIVCGLRNWVILFPIRADNLPKLPDPALLDNSEETNLLDLKSKARSLLKVKDYDGLEKLASEYRKMETPFGSGLIPITLFHESITSLPSEAWEGDLSAKEASLQAWVQTCPNSVTAKIALAKFMAVEAWHYRGSGWASTVTENAASKFHHSLEGALYILDGIKDERKNYSDWYVVFGQVGLGLSIEKTKFFSILDEGLIQYPKSLEISSAGEIYLLPRWYGSNTELVAYVTKTADAIGGDEGDMAYARMARAVSSYTRTENLFSEIGFSWPRVERGMSLICANFPHSTYMLDYFAFFAYQANDYPVSNAVFEHLGSLSLHIGRKKFISYQETPWLTLENFQKAKSWALESKTPD